MSSRTIKNWLSMDVGKKLLGAARKNNLQRQPFENDFFWLQTFMLHLICTLDPMLQKLISIMKGLSAGPDAKPGWT